MADTVTSNVLQSNKADYVIRLTCISDGTGETNVVKIDRSTLTNITGAEPTRISIQSVRWAIQGFSYVKLSWDATTDDTALVISGNGYDNFEAASGLRDPRSSGNVGDLLLTSVNAISGATYDITLVCQLL